MPGSPSPEGRKPGIRQTGQLVTRKGPEGSNPSPGAYFEEPSISLKALAAESKVEEVTTTMDGLTVNKYDRAITARWRNRFHHSGYVKEGTKYKAENTLSNQSFKRLYNTRTYIVRTD